MINDLSGKKIILGVTGGIAVYKSVELASMLVKAGAVVKTIMTASAMEFVSPLTFQTITKETVSWRLFDTEVPTKYRTNHKSFNSPPSWRGGIAKGNDGVVETIFCPIFNRWCYTVKAEEQFEPEHRTPNTENRFSASVHHISLADWAELIVIAPATANVMGKIAGGIADDLLTTTVMAAKCPKLIVPAMNVNMWENPIVQENVRKLSSIQCPVSSSQKYDDEIPNTEHRTPNTAYCYHILEPATGRLACGYEGKGRMPEVYEIYCAIQTYMYHQQDMRGKKVLITAGASIERIDPMRHITNVSSGKMGLALARACVHRGATVTLVHSHIDEPLPYFTQNIQALSAEEMYQTVIDIYKDFDVVMMAAAVADYTPAEPAQQKIKKESGMLPDLALNLKRTKDILAEVGSQKSECPPLTPPRFDGGGSNGSPCFDSGGKQPFLIGFCAESENLLENAKEKLQKKNLDMIVANDLSVAGKDKSEITILMRNAECEMQNYKGDKLNLAHRIIDDYLQLLTLNS